MENEGKPLLEPEPRKDPKKETAAIIESGLDLDNLDMDSGPKVARISGTNIPRAVKKVRPGDVDIVQKARIDSRVVIEVFLNAYGNVTETRFLKGHSLLRKSCLDAVRQWKFEPYLKDRVPCPVRFNIELVYKSGKLEKW